MERSPRGLFCEDGTNGEGKEDIFWGVYQWDIYGCVDDLWGVLNLLGVVFESPCTSLERMDRGMCIFLWGKGERTD